MELAPYVEEKLLAGHKLTTVIEAGLVEEFTKTTRVVALIEASRSDTRATAEQALFIFRTARVPVHSAIDLSVEQIIPVDTFLKCEIDTSSTDVNTDVLVNITAGKVRLLFEMPFSQRTNTFVSEVLKATEVLSKRKGPPPEFSWMQPYLQKIKASVSSNSLNSAEGASTNSMSVSSLLDAGSTQRPLEVSDITPDRSTLSDQNNCSQPASSSIPASCHDLEHITDKSPDFAVNRHSIAMGTSPTPIAARESHIRHQMALREEGYTDIKNFVFFVGTWNVNGQYPSVGLAEWLSCDKDPPDMYAVAFQELDLNKETFLFNTTPREQDWLNAVLNGIHPKARYKKIRLVRLVGIMLIVLAQERLLAYIRDVHVDSVGTGIMNKMGNKGAVAIRLDLHNTSVCFVNAHMAAHVEEFERRNEDHDCIFQRTLFNVNINGPPRNIRNHEHIYFFGDMNYRINSAHFSIKDLADSGQYKLLLEYDQLNQQRSCRRVFHGFKEGNITFKPTFKYDLLSQNWDSVKMRQPAWCDRILWCGEGISQKVYRSHPNLTISDHKPVSAVFEAGIKIVDAKRYRKIYEEVMKKLDRLENEFLPQVTVDNTEIILDTIEFMQAQTKSLTIANTGQVPVQFEFIKKFNDYGYCKPWLSIQPYINFIMPGEKCDVSLTVFVDKQTAFLLNSGSDKLYDILVLHLEGGKDIFITVTGNYERSCFGSSINALVHINVPFKDLPLAKLIDLESDHPKSLSEMPYAVPKELWYLVDHLHSHALQVEGLFTCSGLRKELIEIRSCLDAGVPGDLLPGSVFSVAEALIVLLEALPESVVPASFTKNALDASCNYLMCKDVINRLPEFHRNVFSYLTAFLCELLRHSEDNNLDAKTLAMVFGSVLIRDTEPIEKHVVAQAQERKKQMFIYHFLTNGCS